MLFLRKSTAVDVLIGPFVDAGDGKTAETGLTIDVELSKNGQPLANKSDATAPTDDAAGSIDGYYNCQLNVTDTNTVGTLKLIAFNAAALHVFETFMVLEQDVYDATYGSSATMAASVASILEDTATTIPATIATVDTVVDAVKVVTDAISTNGSGLSAIPWNASWDAEVESEVAEALVAIGLDHLVSASVAGSDVVDNSIVAKLVSKESTADWDDFVNTTDSLQAVRDRGDAAWTTGGGGSAPTAAAVADAVWDEATSGHTTSGTFGEQVKTDIDAILLDTGTTLDGKLDTIDNFLDTEIALILADTGELQTDWANGGRLDLLLDAVLGDTAELQGDWANGGRLDLIVDGILADTAEIGAAGAGLTALWTTDIVEAYAGPTETACTPAQLLYMIFSCVGSFTISSDKVITYDLPGSGTMAQAMRFDMDSTTNPTYRKRDA